MNSYLIEKEKVMSSEIDFDRGNRHVRTISGRKFHLEGNDTTSIYLPDICHALSHMCRFTGHTTRLYTVADHSILVGHLVNKVTEDPHIILQALMHDFPEAYLADIASPFKGLLGNYKALEESTWLRIAKKWNVQPKMFAAVKEADRVALFAEAIELQPLSQPETWMMAGAYHAAGKEQLLTDGIPKLTPEEARAKLQRLVVKYLKLCETERTIQSTVDNKNWDM